MIPSRGLFVASVGPPARSLPVEVSSLPPSFILSLCVTTQLTLFLIYMFDIFCLQLPLPWYVVMRSDVLVASLFGPLWIQLCSCLQFDG